MGATDCIFALKMKEATSADSSAERHHYLSVSKDSGNYVDKLQGVADFSQVFISPPKWCTSS